MARKIILWSITSNNSSYAQCRRIERVQSQPRRAPAAESDDVRKIASSQSSSSLSFSADAREKGAVPL